MNSSEAAALKADDKVFYGDDVVTVVRRTATQVVLSNGIRINKRGDIVGASVWSRYGVHVWTADREAEIMQYRKRRRSINRLHGVAWDRMTDETLSAVVALLPEEAR